MKTDHIDQLFERLDGQFDTEQPEIGHELRFLKKLELQNSSELRSSNGGGFTFFWRPWMSIAASVVLILSLSIGFVSTSESEHDLASVSDEMATTQDYFTSTIQVQLEELKDNIDPEFQDLVVDALFQIQLLEEDYSRLKIDLEESGNDKRVINAMISNFQSRIDILTNVSEQIDELKELKETPNENSSTL